MDDSLCEAGIPMSKWRCLTLPRNLSGVRCVCGAGGLADAEFVADEQIQSLRHRWFASLPAMATPDLLKISAVFGGQSSTQRRSVRGRCPRMAISLDERRSVGRADSSLRISRASTPDRGDRMDMQLADNRAASTFS
jgi:hypothetical protein